MQILTRIARAEGPGVSPPSLWRVVLSNVLSLGGLGVSTYLTIVHFVGNQILACPGGKGGGAVNCEAVITSPQSYVIGIPVAVLGLAYYVVMTVVNSPWAWHARDRRVHILRLVLAVAGIGFVLYLISAELLIIKAICIWCTAVHVITFVQLILVVSTVPAMLGWGTPPEPTPPPPRRNAPARRR